MTTEIDAEGLAAAAEAIDTLWSDGQDRGPAFADTEREYQEHCRSTARAAITAYLATARTSEAEPVAWRYEHQFGVGERWHTYYLERKPDEPNLYRNITPLYPLPTPASDDHVEAVTDDMVRFVQFLDYLDRRAALAKEGK